jgi:hypothetical protein
VVGFGAVEFTPRTADFAWGARWAVGGVPTIEGEGFDGVSLGVVSAGADSAGVVSCVPDGVLELDSVGVVPVGVVSVGVVGVVSVGVVGVVSVGVVSSPLQ